MPFLKLNAYERNLLITLAILALTLFLADFYLGKRDEVRLKVVSTEKSKNLHDD